MREREGGLSENLRREEWGQGWVGWGWGVLLKLCLSLPAVAEAAAVGSIIIHSIHLP